MASVPEPESSVALFHLGLHKTGTTSFQQGLFRARKQLRARGFLYPRAPGDSFPGQHAEIAAMLKQGRVDEVQAYFRDLVDRAARARRPQIRVFLFSSEEFSNLALAQGGLAAFRKAAVECFARRRYVLVLRNVVDLTVSMLRQDIDAGLITPAQAVSEAVILNMLLSFIRKVRLLTGALRPMQVIDYEKARSSGDLTNFLAQKCLGSDAPVLENLRLNVAQERDEQMVDLLLSQARSLIATLRNSNPYSAEVRAELAELVNTTRLAQCVSSSTAGKLAKLFEAKLREITAAVYNANSGLLLKEASALPEGCFRVLLPGLRHPVS